MPSHCDIEKDVSNAAASVTAAHAYTINGVNAGQFKVDGTQDFTITSDRVTANSIVLAHRCSADANSSYVVAVVPAAGKFDVFTNTAPASGTLFEFLIIE